MRKLLVILKNEKLDMNFEIKLDFGEDWDEGRGSYET